MDMESARKSSSEESGSEESGSEESGSDKIKSGKENFVCRFCGQTIIGIRQLIKHEKIHSDVSLYSCEHCSKYFNTEHGLNLHKKTVNCNGRLSREFSCRAMGCVKNYCSKYKRNAHEKRCKKRTYIENGITKERDFVCKRCLVIFKNRYVADNHERICKVIPGKKQCSPEVKLNEEEMKPVDENTTCHVCGRKFSSKKSLSRHKAIHSDAIHSCEYCAKVYKIKDTLMRHLKICKDKLAGKPKLIDTDLGKEGDVEYTCNGDLTNKPEERSTEIIKEGNVETSDGNQTNKPEERSTEIIKENDVETCNGNLTNKTEEVNAEIIEEGDAETSNENLANKHGEINTGIIIPEIKQNSPEIKLNEKMEIQVECISKSTEEMKLLEENNTCSICGRTFSSKKCLRRHKAIHSDTVHSCEYCGKGYKIKESLKAHLKSCNVKFGVKPKEMNTDTRKEGNVEYINKGNLTNKPGEINTEIIKECEVETSNGNLTNKPVEVNAEIIKKGDVDYLYLGAVFECGETTYVWGKFTGKNEAVQNSIPVDIL